MIITKLSPDGNYKVRVEIEEEYKFFLYKKEIKRLGLEEGLDLTEKILEDIYEQILYPRAKEKAFSLLQYRNRTIKEMEQKLLQIGYPKEVRERVISFLKEYRFLDDSHYVRNYIDIYSKRKSRLQIQQELSRKGISKDLFLSMWEEQPEDQEEDSLRQLLEKRVRRTGVTRDNFQKHYAYFARKGYPSSMILKFLKEYQEKDSKDEF